VHEVWDGIEEKR